MPRFPNKQICEKSLRMILVYRSCNTGKSEFLFKHKYVNVFGSDKSLCWVIQQSRFIDHYGLSKWLRTENTKGHPNISSTFIHFDFSPPKNEE